MFAKLNIDEVDVAGKRVFVRVDFDVPKDKAEPTKITKRIDGALPTIKKVLEKGAKSVVLASHLGRCDGLVVAKYSLAPFAKILEEKLGKSVTFCTDCVGPEAEEACADPPAGSVILLLENLRFHVEEEGKGVDAEGKKIKADKEKVKEFRASIRKLADVYCNDAFGTAHHAHSSMIGEGFQVKCSGDLMGKELDAFAKVLDNPAKPVLAIVGGAKVSERAALIKKMLEGVDRMIVCGDMAYTFLSIQDSTSTDDEGAKIVPEILEKAKKLGVEIILPIIGEDGEIEGVKMPDEAPSTVIAVGLEAAKAAKGLAAEVVLFASKPAGIELLQHHEPPGVAALNARAERLSAFAGASPANAHLLGVSIGRGWTRPPATPLAAAGPPNEEATQQWHFLQNLLG